MIIKQLIDEDFVNYKKPSMFIGFSRCSWKCEIECGEKVCQNGTLSTSPDIEISIDSICKRYLNNPITSAIVCGGLEPFDTWDSLYELINVVRQNTEDDIVIYTGYYRREVEKYLLELKKFKNIIVKFGRFMPGCKKHYDPVLGVELASNNQFAENVSNDGEKNMMFSRYIDLDNVTVGECLSIYENDGLEAIINDGRLVNFEEVKEHE